MLTRLICRCYTILSDRISKLKLNPRGFAICTFAFLFSWNAKAQTPYFDHLLPYESRLESFQPLDLLGSLSDIAYYQLATTAPKHRNRLIQSIEIRWEHQTRWVQFIIVNGRYQGMVSDVLNGKDSLVIGYDALGREKSFKRYRYTSNSTNPWLYSDCTFTYQNEVRVKAEEWQYQKTSNVSDTLKLFRSKTFHHINGVLDSSVITGFPVRDYQMNYYYDPGTLQIDSTILQYTDGLGRVLKRKQNFTYNQQRQLISDGFDFNGEMDGTQFFYDAQGLIDSAVYIQQVQAGSWRKEKSIKFSYDRFGNYKSLQYTSLWDRGSAQDKEEAELIFHYYPLPLSTNEFNLEFRCFPNPSKGLINLQFSAPLNGMSIKVVDPIGKVHFANDIKQSGPQALKINLQSGFYYLLMESPDYGLISESILVE